jgi:hypothetical protein
MHDDRMQLKIAHAQRACDLVVEYARSHGLLQILPLAEPIGRALASADPAEIQRQREAVTPKDDDLMHALMTDAELRARWGILEEALGAIKMFDRFSIDRGDIDLGEDAIAARVAKIRHAITLGRPWWQQLISRSGDGQKEGE